MNKRLKVQENTKPYESLIKHHPDAVFEINLEGCILDVNKSFEKISGYKKEDLINKHFGFLLDKEEKGKVNQYFNQATRGRIKNYRTVVFHKSGKKMDIEVTNVPIIYNGEITGVFGVAKDISEKVRLQKELVEKKEELESFFHHTADMVVFCDLEWTIVRANKKFMKTYGYPEKEPLGKKLYNVLTEQSEKYIKLIEKIKKGETIKRKRIKTIKRNNECIDVELTFSPIKNDKGKVVAISGVLQNITDIIKKEKRIKESEEKYKLIAEHSDVLITMITKENIIEYASPSYKKVLGMEPKELVGKSIQEILCSEYKEEIKAILLDVLKGKGKEREKFKRLKKNNDVLWMETEFTPILNNKKEVESIIVVERDVTEQQKYEESLKKMAFYDYLTGACNRRLFMEKLDERILESEKNKERFAVMYLDFDRFKWTNDTFGHEVGDKLLVHFVERLKSCVRKEDVIARLGGDEFAILLSVIEKEEDAEEIAIRVVKELQKSWKINEHEFVITSSVGIAVYPNDGEDTFDLMRHADEALYKAKSSGRNDYRFYHHKKSIEHPNIVFEREVKRAIRNNEFFLEYQPKINLKTKEIVSAEILIRWNHPEKGVVLPNEFVKKAEELELIIPITNWVLKEVEKHRREWKQKRIREIPVSINVSTKHIEKRSLLNDIRNILSNGIMKPKDLIFEITEGVLVHNFKIANETIKKLKKMGIKVAIDDFGTGYSSLSYLIKLDIDKLKLDRSFVQEITAEKNKLLVQSIINLAHTLNLQVIAEGVETKEQEEILSHSNCDIGQGYFFSKPLSFEKFIELVKKQKNDWS